MHLQGPYRITRRVMGVPAQPARETGILVLGQAGSSDPQAQPAVGTEEVR